MELSGSERPVRLVVRDGDLTRPRLLVLIRLVLALPHIVWIVLWFIPATLAVWLSWLVALVDGRVPGSLHRFLAAYVRYGAHLFAYLLGAARHYPGFIGRPGYDLDVHIEPPERQRRLTTLFRLFLGLPAFVLAFFVGAGVILWPVSTIVLPIAFPSVTLLAYFGVLSWWAALVLGRNPSGMRDFVAYGIGYHVQAAGYLLLLTDRYPNASPALVEPALSLDPHPVHLRLTDEPRRSRWTVFFRLPLTVPHWIWLALWGIAALFAAIAAWLAALVTGRVPVVLHRFLAAYVRQSAHVAAFVTVVGGPFPGFTGGTYPVELEIDPPEKQRRLVTLFRVVLAFPAVVIAYVVGYTLLLIAIFAWFSSLVRGRVPEGLRDLGAAAIRYHGQLSAYALLLTARYPYASPALVSPPAPALQQPSALGESD